MLTERLTKALRARRGETPLDPVMRFSSEGLVLGTGTILARSRASARDVVVDPRDSRLQALLAAAHLRRPTSSALIHLRKAAECWSRGEDAYAAMHLSLSWLDRLGQPEADAHRLFLADSLLKSGIEANAVIAAAESGGGALERLHKFNPDQPRVPAGSGRSSGEWTSGDAAASSEVNQATVTPASIFTYKPTPGRYDGDDACYRAKLDCQYYALYPTTYDDRNIKWAATEVMRCNAAAAGCEFISDSVKIFGKAGSAVFPHGGVVMMKGGQTDIYLPHVRQGGSPPFPH